MYIETVPNRNSPPTVLLRESRRDGEKIIKRTLANLSDWPEQKVAALRAVLKGDYQRITSDHFVIEKSLAHGHVQAILAVMKQIGLDSLLYSKPLRQRKLVMAMIAEQLIHPCSKLGQVRIIPGTTLAEQLGLGPISEDDLYQAMDWLAGRQPHIEKKLAGKHLGEGAHVFYDVTSSYYEGRTCVLARHGHNRDGKKGKKIIVYGVMCDGQGRPVGVDVYAGNTGDPSTVADQVEKLRIRFGLERVVLVGDRGMLTQTQLEVVKQHPGIGWISALRSDGIRKLVAEGSFQPSLFDRQALAEISSAHYPGERLVVCYNPLMAAERKRKRQELLAATEAELQKIVLRVRRRKKKLHTAEEIALMAGRVVNRYKMSKHVELTIGHGQFSYHLNTEQIRNEAGLDGFYVIRTSEPASRISAEDAVRQYKNLSKVETVFRTLKGVEILVRPIRHRKEERVRAHIFLCMLAYYVEWHMRQQLAPILFTDEQAQANSQRRHPVSPAEPSASVKQKKITRTTEDGLPLHSFKTLLAALATHTRNHCRFQSDRADQLIPVLSQLTPLQRRAFELLGIRTQ